MRKIAIFITAALCVSAALAVPPAAPTFQELMDPALYTDPQRGLVVESVQEEEGVIRIFTTGALIEIQGSTGDIHFTQRIGHNRPLARLRLGMPLEGVKVTHRGPGFARLSVDHPRMQIRINGDSLFMLHAGERLDGAVESRIAAAWHASFKNNHLIADEWGGFGLYTSMKGIDEAYDPYGETTAVYPLEPDAVLWVASCPPKPYDWDRSLKDNVVWHWSNTQGYPDNETLASWKDNGNTVLLQSEVMLWKDWNLDFVPRLGPEEFARVRDTLHGLGMRFIVYTSPYYFLRGTDLEPAAFSGFEGFTNWPPGKPTGENMGLFLDAIRRVMAEYRPDGLYFDGQYMENPAALYALARSAREIVGEEGILEWHSTWALGSEGCYLPPADAYVDFILRGEGQEKRHLDGDYLRFFVSGYNIHNSIGVLCNNGAARLTPELAKTALDMNARFHTLAGWLHNPEVMDVIHTAYQPRLRPALREEVDAAVDFRQQKVASTAEAGRRENEALAQPPNWDAPVFSCMFKSLPTVETLVSQENDAPFSIVEDTLHITAKAHAHAYYRFPLSQSIGGFVARIRQGTDGGMSWGPGVLAHWPDGSAIRVGLRADGLVQADILGAQLLAVVPASGADGWVWLRARWRDKRGVIECSPDGLSYTRLWTFEHGGIFRRAADALLAGKVPYNGEPLDHSEPGVPGTSAIAFVEAYAGE